MTIEISLSKFQFAQRNNKRQKTILEQLGYRGVLSQRESRISSFLSLVVTSHSPPFHSTTPNRSTEFHRVPSCSILILCNHRHTRHVVSSHGVSVSFYHNSISAFIPPFFHLISPIYEHGQSPSINELFTSILFHRVIRIITFISTYCFVARGIMFCKLCPSFYFISIDFKMIVTSPNFWLGFIQYWKSPWWNVLLQRNFILRSSRLFIIIYCHLLLLFFRFLFQ